jgi:hypothetical protein
MGRSASRPEAENSVSILNRDCYNSDDPTNMRADRDSTSRKRILIVEDNDLNVILLNDFLEFHGPVVPGSPICGMRMPTAAGARGHSAAASDRRLDSPAGLKGRRNCHRHADKQLKVPEKLETHLPFQISPATPIC